MAYLYLLSSSGGILQGDRYRTEIALKNNAVAHITTQGATRIYGMNNNYASQTVNITVQQGSYLEYIPDSNDTIQKFQVSPKGKHSGLTNNPH